MSDQLDAQRQIATIQAQLERLRKADTAPLWLPYAQRALNPQAAGAALGDFAQPWPMLPLVFSCSVFVTGTNDGGNYWTINLNDTTGTTIATVNTSAMAPNTWTRLADTSVTQPATTNAELAVITAITAGAPGTIYVVPAVSALRTGN